VLSEVEAQAPASAPNPNQARIPHIVPPPAIILVRPQLGENIGKAARAMLNFGLTEMRLVAPRDGWPNPQAGPAASGADVVLERAQVFETVADAVADCAHVYATTVRKRGVTKPVVTPEIAAQAIHRGPGRSALLFGPERSGLETDDVALARTILTVPINPEFGSLNLAQAVILVAYEWSRHVPSNGQGHVDLASPPEVELDSPAPQEELDGMIAQLDGMLEASGFFFPPDRVPATRRTLRTVLTKPGWSSQEIRTLRGVLSALAGAKLKRNER
jgi:tRNA/rRNA methyltransferase